MEKNEKKSTSELLELMKKSTDYKSYRKNAETELSVGFMKVDRALAVLLTEKNLKKADVIAKSGIEIHYAYQIFSGVKVPCRDKLVMLCFGLGLDAQESQTLLKITGYPQLYAKNERDNAILFGLTKKMSVIELNTLLYDLKAEILI